MFLFSLEGIWTGKNVSYSHLMMFECKAFAHVPKEQWLKLDEVSPYMFIGYGGAEFGYTL